MNHEAARTQDAVRPRAMSQFRRNDPVRWRPGEREALIAEALAKGHVTQVPRGQSAYTQDSSQQRSFGTLPTIR